MNGRMFQKMTEAGYACLKAHADEVNDLNVFPIPDGDTGDNMRSTLSGGLKVVSGDDDLSAVAASLSGGMVLGARGNSGVILSQIFSGLAQGFEGKASASVAEIKTALEKAVEVAYKAVDNPVEGTMLTVLRTAVENVVDIVSDGDSEDTLFRTLLDASKLAVEETPEQLYCLKEAGVVDSGGKGLSYILEGFLAAVIGEEIAYTESSEVKESGKELDLSLFDENSVMQFGYCTEFLLRLQTSKIDVDGFSVDGFIEELKGFGDSIVCFKTGTIVKVHVHTFNPGRVLESCQRYGEFLTLKIENMTLQHEGTVKSSRQEFKKNAVRRKFGMIAVATGEGVKKAFEELGVDIVVDGGQGKNPSTEDFIRAYDALNADVVFVLPDNGNIIPVAEKSAEIYSDSEITVIPTKSIGDGYSALSAFDLSIGEEECAEAMLEAAKSSCSIEVCRAVRTTTVGGVSIEEGDYIGFVGKTMLAAGKERTAVVLDCLKKQGAEENEFLIVIAGKGVGDEAEKLKSEVEKAYPDIEAYALDGGQDTFDYILVLQ